MSGTILKGTITVICVQPSFGTASSPSQLALRWCRS